MDLDGIRQAFNLANVVVSDGALSLLYTQTDNRWINQTISEDDGFSNKRVFETILNNADVFEIHLIAPRKLRLDFLIPEGMTGNVQNLWFLPLDRLKPLSEIEDELKESIKNWSSERKREFNDFFTPLRERNARPEEVLEAVQIWFSEHGVFDELPDFDPDCQEKLIELARELEGMSPVGKLDIDDFFVEFQTETAKHRVFRFSGESKNLLYEMVCTAHSLDFEAGNNDGGKLTYLNLTFYA